MKDIDFAALAEWFQPMIDEFVKMGQSAQTFIPVFLQGLVFFIVLVFIAGVARLIIRGIGRRLGLDAAAEKFGLQKMFSKIGIKAPLSKVVSKLVYWMILLYALKAASDIWGITDISNFVNSLILFLPRLFVAVFILFAGLLVADLVRNAVETALDNIDFDHAGLVASFIYGLLAVMIMTVVLGQLGIQTELLNSAVKILLAAGGLAVALALGLGLRGVARNVVSGVYARDLFPPGSVLEIEDMYGVVVEVGAVATRIESGEGVFIVIPNSELVSKLNKGRRIPSEITEKV